MKTMDKNELLDSLEKYGYPLMRPALTSQPQKILETLLRQDEVRLLEGFPVVLAHALQEKKILTWENPKWNPKQELSGKNQYRLAFLLALSSLLFELFGLDKVFQARSSKLLSKLRSGDEALEKLRKSFSESKAILMDEVLLSTERLKNNFLNYVMYRPESEEAQKKKHTLELELLLSEIFTPRQKELLRKRLEGKLFTKTEREYFYRVVKKRLRTLASEELHQMARSVLLK